MNRLKDRRAVYLVPNTITCTSMFFGFLSIIWAVQGRFSDACLALLVSALMDGLDGKVARLTHSASEFGVQFDSLADLVAFGLAPAVLLFQWQLAELGRLGVAIAFVYAACGALRLARFNVNAHVGSKRYFVGLPIPAGSCTLVCFVFFAELFRDSLPTLTLIMSAVLTFGVGLLMVSNVRYFSFKEYDIFRAHPYRFLVLFLILLALLYSQPKVVGFLYCAIYIVSGLLYTLVLLPRHTNVQLLRTSSTDE
ncbi:MAG: CDP-diacylglycerol--serine O-phosphatidyltransferase [Desulfovibrionaceae bacterium]|nr:CDP-diacylglycerol--serine O-phosphatidyltransferase [Desulfovibrionaceae bacterium]